MILDRYLLKEIIPNFFLGLLIFTFVMLMNQILVLAEALITKGVGFHVIFLILYYSLPALSVLTIPMSLLLGILLGMGRLSADSELTVMRSSGISIYRLMISPLLLGAVMWGICSYMIQVTVPWGNYSLVQLTYKIMMTNTASELKPRIFYNKFTNMLLYVQDVSTRGDLWKGVLLYDESFPEKARLVLASEGVIRPRKGSEDELELELHNGSWHEVDVNVPDDYTFVYFTENVFPLPTPGRFPGQLPKSDREETIPELRDRIEQHKARLIPYQFLQVEIYKKYSIPFACMVFSFLAITLGMSPRKGSRSSAYATSIGIILLYYVFLISGEKLADEARIPPWLGAWAANLILGSLGILLFLHLNSNSFRRMVEYMSNTIQNWINRSSRTQARQGKRVRVVIRVQRFPWRMFTLLDKYIVVQFLKNFVIIMIALILIAELIEATQMVGHLFRNNVPASVLFQYLKFNIPQWVFYVVPVTALTTTLITFGAMTKNSEIIAMKSSGISLYRISLPLIIVALSLSVFMYWLQDYILPYTNRIAHDYRRILRGLPPETYTAFERRWLAGAEGFYNYDLFDKNQNKMYGFAFFELDPESFALKRRVYSREAFYQNGRWILLSGWQRLFHENKMHYENFDRLELSLPITPDQFTAKEQLPSEMNFAELRKYTLRMKERGYEFIRFAVDLQAKLSFPTVSLILTLIAIPFSFTTGRKGALFGIGISILTGIAFWFFLALTKSLGYLEILNPFLAAWTPNIFATLMALYLLFKLRT